MYKRQGRLVLHRDLSKYDLRQNGGAAVCMADGHAAEPLLPAAEAAERFALQTRACIVRLNAFDLSLIHI